MTDITELAQSLKAAAEKATQGNWRAFQYHDGRCGIGGGHHDEIMVCEHISKERPHDAMFIALANPANVLALVEALENAQQRIDELEFIRTSADKVQREFADELGCAGDNESILHAIDDLKQQAEPRTVTVENLQESAYRAGLTAGWNLGLANNNDGFNKCLAAHTAGIKVEAE
ncbi:ead/Ea22-like family protein [Klebsiella quasipneumoniae]|uniref:ead/Ea22-like family protein n=1 Tax=Klebsiella quasipneumoniae TaxID=1463165 RepID=UPI001EF63627|nr:ead/Ea22-like family protein [Klebsiella quasipneumoniae]